MHKKKKNPSIYANQQQINTHKGTKFTENSRTPHQNTPYNYVLQPHLRLKSNMPKRVGRKIKPWRQKIGQQKREKKECEEVLEFGVVKGLVRIWRNLWKWDGWLQRMYLWRWRKWYGRWQIEYNPQEPLTTYFYIKWYNPNFQVIWLSKNVLIKFFYKKLYKNINFKVFNYIDLLIKNT